MAESLSKEDIIRTLKSMSSKERTEIVEVIERLERVPTSVDPTSVDPKKLIRAISEVYPCVGKRGMSIALCHILFDVKNGCLTLVAADGFKMAISTLSVDLPDGQWLIHHKETQKVKSVLRRTEELKAIAGDGSLTFLAKTREGEEKIVVTFKSLSYHDWRKVFAIHVSSSYKTKVTFKAKEMEEALRLVKSEFMGATKLYIEEESIKLSNRDPATEKEKEAVIKAQITGEPGRQAFQWNHLMKVANTFRGAVTLNTNGGSGTALFEKDDTKWLVMPMFVNW